MGHPARILVVEDEAALANLIQRVLGMYDAEGVVLSTPEEALQMLRDESFDCLLTDLNLWNSPLSGLDLVSQARETREGIHCVVMSGDVGGVDQKRFQPPLLTLQKPFGVAALVAALGLDSA